MFRTYYHNAYHLFFINLQHHIMHSSYRKNKANWLRKTEHSYKKHNIVFASKRTLPTQRTIKWLIESQKVIPWIGGNWVQFAFRLLPAFEVHLLILKRRHTIFFENNIARKFLFVNYKSYLLTQRLDQPLYGGIERVMFTRMNSIVIQKFQFYSHCVVWMCWLIKFLTIFDSPWCAFERKDCKRQIPLIWALGSQEIEDDLSIWQYQCFYSHDAYSTQKKWKINTKKAFKATRLCSNRGNCGRNPKISLSSAIF